MKRWQYIIGVLVVLFAISFLIGKFFTNVETIQRDEILIIPIHGIISNTRQTTLLSSSEVSSDKIISSIKKAKESKNIKAVIFEINSPGGTVVASKEIADAVKKLDKPKVALIRDVGASGAYWIASSADKIVADELSITGSIGVISSYLEFSDLLDKYGITYERLVSGKYKDIGSPYKNLTDARRIETGEFLLGIEAKELGLIDYLGNKETAIKVAKELSDIKEAKLVEFKEKKSIFDVLNRISASSFYYLGQGIGSQLYVENKNSKLEINAI